MFSEPKQGHSQSDALYFPGLCPGIFLNPDDGQHGSLPASGEIAAKVQKICFENGLVAEKGGRGGSVMRCLCALNITKDEINTAMDIFEKVVLQVAKDYE